MLYLRSGSFVGDEAHGLAADLRSACAAGMHVLAIHENDPAQGGCAFSHFLTTTPEDLVEGGLYTSLAVALHAAPHREISIALAAKALGASKRKGVRLAAAGRLSAAAAKTASMLASSMRASREQGSVRGSTSASRSSVRRSSRASDGEQEAEDTAPGGSLLHLALAARHSATRVVSRGRAEPGSAAAAAHGVHAMEEGVRTTKFRARLR